MADHGSRESRGRLSGCDTACPAQDRTIVAGFMKDKSIGNKRLASMPDRMTNTIETVDAGRVCRPTVINCYSTPMDSPAEWWQQWRDFMFRAVVSVKTKGGSATKHVYELLDPISPEKYPAITPVEAAVSLPLQTLCLAIFDATLTHMLNTLAPGRWFPIKVGATPRPTSPPPRPAPRV